MVRCLGLLFPSHDWPIIGQPQLGYNFHPAHGNVANPTVKSIHQKLRDKLNDTLCNSVLDNISKSGIRDNHNTPVSKG
jgi:hypothetical protein